jgi:plastocyanin
LIFETRFIRGLWVAAVIMLFVVLGMKPAWAQGTVVQAHVTVEHADSPSKLEGNQDVAVWLDPMDPASVPAAAKTKYRMLQRDKEFHPRVLAVPVGAAVEFPNNDPFFHNVFSLYKGKRFDLGLYESGSSRIVHFDRPGVSFIFCNIHPEMEAYILALETPYFAVSGPRGDIRMRGVAPGRYRLRVWYERAESNHLAELSREVTVSGAVLNLGNLSVPESARLLPQHMDKHGGPYEVDRKPYPE